MECSIINKKLVRGNKSLKLAQKAAKKRYGRVRGKAPKAKINKVVILDGQGFIRLTETEGKKKVQIPSALTGEILVSKIKEYGLTGLSGSFFPTDVKIQTFINSKSQNKYLIINGVECDPGLIHDEWLLKNRYEEVKRGAEVLNRCFHFKKIILASKTEDTDRDSLIHMLKVPNRYPMGYEKTLVKTVFDVEIGIDEFPVSKGILVLNIQTVLAIGEALCGESCLSSRYLTVADLTEGHAVVVKAEIGTPVADVISRVYPKLSGFNVYTGEGVMGCHKAETDERVAANTNLIAYAQKPDYDSATKCRGCGRCTSKCPMGVDVCRIVKAVESGNAEGLETFHPEKCIRCSACTYICRAGKNTQGIIAMINGDV